MGLFKSARCTSLARLDGKTAIITGANTGIGKFTAEDFFLRGARVIMVCRNLEKAKQAVEEIKEKHKEKENAGELLTAELNLSDLQSVRKCAKHLLDTEEKVNLLINNAGLMCPKSTTVDGFEMQFGSNYLGHFLLTILLLPKIRKSVPARIVNVSSDAHFGKRLDFSDLNFEKKKYTENSAYQQSKLANILFTKELAKRLKGARVVIACRNLEKANDAAKAIKEKCKDKKQLGQIVVTELDLSKLASVRKCAKHLLDNEQRIDLLINNAGVMVCPKLKTEDGYEMQYGTNHLGHFLFTLLLLPKICQSTPARIVNVSSMAHNRASIDFSDLNSDKKKYSAVGAYGQSKLANILFTRELARIIREKGIGGVNVYSLHPGVIKTELGRHMDDTYFRGARFLGSLAMSWMSISVEEGAQTTIYCAVDEKCANETGLYYDKCAVKEPTNKAAKNDQDAKTLWDISLKQVKLDENYDPFKQQQ